MKQSMEDN